MESDSRPDFNAALEKFINFLEQEGWPTEIIWLAKNRVSSHKRNAWVFRPQDLCDPSISRNFYNEILDGDFSIKLEGLGQLDGRSVIFIEKYVGDPYQFYMSLAVNGYLICPVGNHFKWVWIKVINCMRGQSPLFKYVQIPLNA